MSDKIIFNKRFEFDAEVSDCFEDMLKRSIPEYDMMRGLVSKVGERFVVPNTTILDAGCSRGDAVYPFVLRHMAECHFELYDTSEPMLEICQDKYDPIESVTVRRHDICEGVPIDNVSLVLSVLTVQFTPIELRHRILSSFYDCLNDGGALIYVEKVLGDTTRINDVLVDCYYEQKADNGYTREQIESKRVSLEGVLVPVTAKWNEDLLKKTGFSQVDCFWRSLNFCGWVAIK